MNQAMTFSLDDEVAIPRKKGKPANHKPHDWPFARMQVGQSFFSPGFSHAVRTAAGDHERLFPPTKFTSRMFDGIRSDPPFDPVTGQVGVRIWRIR
jgi:hypothetical protein